VQEEIALALVEGGQLQIGCCIGHVAPDGMLHRRVDGKDVELVHLAELCRQRCRRGHIAHLPTGDVVGLAEARHDEGPLHQPRHRGRADVRHAVEHHVFVDLVADQQGVGVLQQGGQLFELATRPHGGAGVVWTVDQDHSRARRQGRCDALEVRAEAARRQRHTHHAASGQFDVRRVAVVARFQHHHLVARVHGAQDGRQDALRGARRDGDFAAGVIAVAVQLRQLVGHALAQQRDARHRRVLVQAVAHGRCDGVDQGRVAVEIGKALAQVHRACFLRQRRHDGEDGGAHLGQSAGQGRCCGVRMRVQDRVHRSGPHRV